MVGVIISLLSGYRGNSIPQMIDGIHIKESFSNARNIFLRCNFQTGELAEYDVFRGVGVNLNHLLHFLFMPVFGIRGCSRGFRTVNFRFGRAPHQVTQSVFGFLALI